MYIPLLFCIKTIVFVAMDFYDDLFLCLPSDDQYDQIAGEIERKNIKTLGFPDYQTMRDDRREIKQIIEDKNTLKNIYLRKTRLFKHSHDKRHSNDLSFLGLYDVLAVYGTIDYDGSWNKKETTHNFYVLYGSSPSINYDIENSSIYTETDTHYKISGEIKFDLIVNNLKFIWNTIFYAANFLKIKHLVLTPMGFSTKTWNYFMEINNRDFERYFESVIKLCIHIPLTLFLNKNPDAKVYMCLNAEYSGVDLYNLQKKYVEMYLGNIVLSIFTDPFDLVETIASTNPSVDTGIVCDTKSSAIGSNWEVKGNRNTIDRDAHSRSRILPSISWVLTRVSEKTQEISNRRDLLKLNVLESGGKVIENYTKKMQLSTV